MGKCSYGVLLLCTWLLSNAALATACFWFEWSQYFTLESKLTWCALASSIVFFAGQRALQSSCLQPRCSAKESVLGWVLHSALVGLCCASVVTAVVAALFKINTVEALKAAAFDKPWLYSWLAVQVLGSLLQLLAALLKQMCSVAVRDIEADPCGKRAFSGKVNVGSTRIPIAIRSRSGIGAKPEPSPKRALVYWQRFLRWSRANETLATVRYLTDVVYSRSTSTSSSTSSNSSSSLAAPTIVQRSASASPLSSPKSSIGASSNNLAINQGSRSISGVAKETENHDDREIYIVDWLRCQLCRESKMDDNSTSAFRPATLICGHSFHRLCIEQWSRQHSESSCPGCLNTLVCEEL
jgi:hypothetical protein